MTENLYSRSLSKVVIISLALLSAPSALAGEGSEEDRTRTKDAFIMGASAVYAVGGGYRELVMPSLDTIRQAEAKSARLAKLAALQRGVQQDLAQVNAALSSRTRDDLDFGRTAGALSLTEIQRRKKLIHSYCAHLASRYDEMDLIEVKVIGTKGKGSDLTLIGTLDEVLQKLRRLDPAKVSALERVRADRNAELALKTVRGSLEEGSARLKEEIRKISASKTEAVQAASATKYSLARAAKIGSVIGAAMIAVDAGYRVFESDPKVADRRNKRIAESALSGQERESLSSESVAAR